MLKLKGLALGDWQTNCYAAWLDDAPVADDGTRACWVFDAPPEIERMIALLKAERLTPERLLLTHAHVDHIAGVTALRAAFPAMTVTIHEAEQAWLKNSTLNLSVFSGTPVTTAPAERVLKHEDTLEMPGLTWTALHVPGHSPGSVAYFAPSAGVCVGGDALFAGSIGRTDFPGCSHAELIASIRTRLLTLPGATRIFPGHGPATTIEREKTTNPFLED
ncbi:MBL fold metallo-hydrolase [soil metagenome]